MEMKFSWNKEIKQLMGALAGVLFLGSVICSLMIGRYQGAVNVEFNLAVAAMLDSVMEVYPETSEEELIAVLSRGGTDRGDGEELLGKYGIFLREAGSSFPSVGRAGEKSLAEFCIAGFWMVGSILLILFAYLKRRQQEIEELCGYVDEVSKGNFRLDVLENRDSELSSLKNELYKLTTLLSEQAKRAVDNRKALSDAVANISHQLKTPLTSVTVLVDNLAENQDMDIVTRNRFLQEISRQLSGVSWLIATLLKLSRLDAGVVELERKPLELRLLAKTVYEKLELLAEWRQVEIKLGISEKIWISGDAQWLTEAFLNLVKNAIEHSNPGGMVEVTAEDNDVYTQVTVRDYGEGIDANGQKHLFERFYRGRSAGADSVGIGLALSKEIIDRQGGYITVESDRGRGTAFFIKFIKCH